MENNAKISKFFDKAKERLRFYFNLFRRKTENYVEDIEEEIIDESENDKIEGLNKLKNVMENVEKIKGMKALKDNQQNEKIKESFNQFNKSMIEKKENYVKDNEEEIIDKIENDKIKGLNKLKNVMENVEKVKGMKALKDNQQNEKIKESFNQFNKSMIEKDKQKGIDVLKNNQKTEIKKEKLNKLGDIFQKKSK